MPATKKSAGPRAVVAARDRAESDARRLDQIAESLQDAQKDLASIGGSLGTGVRDLRRDVSKLLRDARRDLVKMRRAVQRDLERLQKDLGSAATASVDGRGTATKKPAPTGARKRAAGSH